MRWRSPVPRRMKFENCVRNLCQNILMLMLMHVLNKCTCLTCTLFFCCVALQSGRGHAHLQQCGRQPKGKEAQGSRVGNTAAHHILWPTVYVNRVKRCSFEVDIRSDKHSLSIRAADIPCIQGCYEALPQPLAQLLATGQLLQSASRLAWQVPCGNTL